MNFKFDIKSLLKSKKKSEGDESELSPSVTNKKLNTILIWIKSNILVLSVTSASVATLCVATVISFGLFEDKTTQANEYGKILADLKKLKTTPVSIIIPGNEPTTGNVLVNRKLIDAVKLRMSKGVSGGSELLQIALDHNHGNHTPIISLRLTKDDPKFAQIHLDMYDKLLERYEQLFKRCRAALPPAEEDILIELQRSKLRFIQAELSKSIDMKLTPEEQLKLVSDLTNRRLAAYKGVAISSGLYLDGQSLGVPAKPLDEPNLLQLWMLQWKYWIVEDILDACSKANKDGSIATSPIKRIVGIQFPGPVSAGVSETLGAETNGETDAAPTDESGSGASLGLPIDPNALVPLSNFTNSFQGWGSNQLYDVYRTTVTLVVETAKIPLVTDAIVQQNFIAITNVRISPVDPFVAIQSGFFYGESPVSNVVLSLESIWLRQWTGPLMPDEVRLKFNTTGQVQGVLSPDTNSATIPSPSHESN